MISSSWQCSYWGSEGSSQIDSGSLQSLCGGNRIRAVSLNTSRKRCEQGRLVSSHTFITLYTTGSRAATFIFYNTNILHNCNNQVHSSTISLSFSLWTFITFLMTFAIEHCSSLLPFINVKLPNFQLTIYGFQNKQFKSVFVL